MFCETEYKDYIVELFMHILLFNRLLRATESKNVSESDETDSSRIWRKFEFYRKSLKKMQFCFLRARLDLLKYGRCPPGGVVMLFQTKIYDLSRSYKALN